jgi:hypothetical protein
VTLLEIADVTIGIASDVRGRIGTLADCSKLLAKITPEFDAGRLKPLSISERARLAKIGELYTFADNGGGGKAVLSVGKEATVFVSSQPALSSAF